jgi:hypothetical protein
MADQIMNDIGDADDAINMIDTIDRMNSLID